MNNEVRVRHKKKGASLKYAYSLLEGTGLTCVMKNRNQLTPSSDIYFVWVYMQPKGSE